MGLSRNEKPLLSNETIQSGPIFSDFLAKNNITSDRRFSFSLDYFGDYFVDFGAPQAKTISNVNEIKYIPMYEDFYWSAAGLGVAFGDLASENTYGFKQDLYTIFDTGSSAIMLSSDYFTQFV